MTEEVRGLARETADLTVYMTRTFQNIIPTMLEMIAEIVEHIGDDDLTTTIRGKLMALSVVQDQIRRKDE